MTPADLQIPGRGSAPIEDPAIVAAKEAEAAKAAWFAIPVSTVADEKAPKYKAAEKRSKEADDAFADAPVTSLAGALVKLRALLKDIVEDEGVSWGARHVKTVAAFLEGFTGAPSVVGDDPAVAAFAELKEAWTAFDALPDEVEEQIDAAAYKRVAVARDAVRDAVPVSLAGVAAKVRALLEPYRADVDAVGLDHAYDRSAKLMLPFLEGAPAPIPKPDPVVTLFAEFGAIQAEKVALSKAFPDPGKWDHHTEDQQTDLSERQHAIEGRIIETDATSVRGLAVKLRLMAYFQYSMPGLEERHATPAKDIDWTAMIEAWREDSGLSMDDELLLGALRDAERLAGVS